MYRFFFILLFLLLLSCVDKNDISSRLENFYKLLDEPQKSNFQNKKLDAVVLYLENKNSDLGFKKSKYQKLLKKEWVDFFTEEQMVEYFYILYQRKIKIKK